MIHTTAQIYHTDYPDIFIAVSEIYDAFFGESPDQIADIGWVVAAAEGINQLGYPDLEEIKEHGIDEFTQEVLAIYQLAMERICLVHDMRINPVLSYNEIELLEEAYNTLEATMQELKDILRKDQA